MAVNHYLGGIDAVARRDLAANLTAAGGPYYWIFPTYQAERIGWQGIKTTTAGGGTWTFFVSLAPTSRAAEILPADGTLTAALDQIWQPDTALVFSSDPADLSLWNPLPLQASGFAWRWVLAQLTVTVDIPRLGLKLFYAHG